MDMNSQAIIIVHLSSGNSELKSEQIIFSVHVATFVIRTSNELALSIPDGRLIQNIALYADTCKLLNIY